jgi:serine/threonine protein phosphatase 1
MLTFTLAPGILPQDVRVYAVGDVHGCADRLDALHSDILADLARRPVAQPWLIHLGDYVDRGEDSAGVVQRLVRAPQLLSSKVPGLMMGNLMGNHEHMMLSVLAEGDPQLAKLWMRNGGEPALRSWGIDGTEPASRWKHRIPLEHLVWLRGLDLYLELGSYLFVHAGLRPGIALADQTQDDLLWIREPFLSWQGEFGAVVVHGHTPGEEPVVRSNRIGVDTGAVLGGRLTCVVLQSDQMGFLSR